MYAAHKTFLRNGIQCQEHCAATTQLHFRLVTEYLTQRLWINNSAASRQRSQLNLVHATDERRSISQQRRYVVVPKTILLHLSDSLTRTTNRCRCRPLFSNKKRLKDDPQTITLLLPFYPFRSSNLPPFVSTHRSPSISFT